MPDGAAALDPIDVLYLTSLLADRRRPIDRYIDYFGGRWSDREGPSGSPRGTRRDDS